jgi:hypothetical protein
VGGSPNGRGCSSAESADRAMGLEMALESISKKKVVWHGGGLQKRLKRAQTRVAFPNLDPIDFAVLARARAYKLAKMLLASVKKIFLPLLQALSVSPSAGLHKGVHWTSQFRSLEHVAVLPIAVSPD